MAGAPSKQTAGSGQTGFLYYYQLCRPPCGVYWYTSHADNHLKNSHGVTSVLCNSCGRGSSATIVIGASHHARVIVDCTTGNSLPIEVEAHLRVAPGSKLDWSLRTARVVYFAFFATFHAQQKLQHHCLYTLLLPSYLYYPRKMPAEPDRAPYWLVAAPSTTVCFAGA